MCDGLCVDQVRGGADGQLLLQSSSDVAPACQQKRIVRVWLQLRDQLSLLLPFHLHAPLVIKDLWTHTGTQVRCCKKKKEDATGAWCILHREVMIFHQYGCCDAHEDKSAGFWEAKLGLALIWHSDCVWFPNLLSCPHPAVCLFFCFNYKLCFFLLSDCCNEIQSSRQIIAASKQETHLARLVLFCAKTRSLHRDTLKDAFFQQHNTAFIFAVHFTLCMIQ